MDDKFQGEVWMDGLNGGINTIWWYKYQYSICQQLSTCIAIM